MKILITFFVIAFSTSLYAQESIATIYFHDGTKQIGLAEIRNFRIIFYYNGKKKKYDEDEVSHINMTEGKNRGMYYYKTILGRKKVILVHLYFEGKVNLYREYSEVVRGGFDANGGFIGGGDPQIVEKFFINQDIEDLEIRDLGNGNVISKDFKKIAPTYFGDCIMLMKKIRTDYFGKYKIKNVVNMYNTQCK